MRAAGLDATGEIGDGDPIQAIEDAVRTFRPDELIISTHPAGPLALARAGRRREGARALRASRSPTSSSISTLRPELTIDVVDPLPLRAELREVHRSALGAGALSDEWAATRLPAHTTRDDFVFLVAREERRGRGVRLRLHGRVRPVVDRPRRARRSPPRSARSGSTCRTSRSSSCTCGRRGSGAASGARCSRSSSDRQPHDRALLSTQTGSRKARGFYAKNGWRELASVDFGPGYPPYIVLGKTRLSRAPPVPAITSRRQSRRRPRRP